MKITRNELRGLIKEEMVRLAEGDFPEEKYGMSDLPFGQEPGPQMGAQEMGMVSVPAGWAERVVAHTIIGKIGRADALPFLKAVLEGDYAADKELTGHIMRILGADVQTFNSLDPQGKFTDGVVEELRKALGQPGRRADL